MTYTANHFTHDLSIIQRMLKALDPSAYKQMHLAFKCFANIIHLPPFLFLKDICSWQETPFSEWNILAGQWFWTTFWKCKYLIPNYWNVMGLPFISNLVYRKAVLLYMWNVYCCCWSGVKKIIETGCDQELSSSRSKGLFLLSVRKSFTNTYFLILKTLATLLNIKNVFKTL